MPVLNRWLARFSFSLLILAALLAWTAFKEQKQSGFGWRPALWGAGAAAAMVVGAMGVRARHRSVDDDGRL